MGILRRSFAKAGLLITAPLVLCQCALTPRDGQVIASRSTPIHYEFVVPWAMPDIYVEAARYDSNGNFAYWDFEWGCNLQAGGCGETPLGVADGSGNSDYWVVRRDEALPTTILVGTRHWIRTGLTTPKWKAQIRGFAAPTNTGNYSRIATFANTTAATNCIVNKFLEETGAYVAVNCDTGDYVANIYANAD